MALNINRSRLNDSIQRMLSFMMQNKLGELSNERYFDRSMGVMSEQDRLMRERAASADVQARALKSYESKINVDEYIKKAFIDTAKSNDAFDYNVRAGQVAKESGDMAKAKEHYGIAYNMAIPNLTARMNALKGKVDESDFLATMEAFGEDGVEKIMSEAGTNARAAQQLPIQKSQAATSAGNLALQQAKEARSLTGQVPQDEYAKVISTKVQKTMDNINSLMGILRGTSGAGNAYNVEEVIKSIEGSGASRLLGGAVSPQALAKMYGELSRYETKAMTGRLSPTEMRRLDDSLNVFGDYSIPRENDMAIQLGKDTTAAIEADGQVAPVTPPPVAPQSAIPAEVQAYMLKHPELSLDFVMKKYQEYMRLKGVE